MESFGEPAYIYWAQDFQTRGSGFNGSWVISVGLNETEAFLPIKDGEGCRHFLYIVSDSKVPPMVANEKEVHGWWTVKICDSFSTYGKVSVE